MYGSLAKANAHNAKARLTDSYNSLLKDISSPLPRTIGNYKILEPIGEGAFGKAYLAYHVLTKVKVVLKASAKNQSNLVREIQHHRNFRHPHITKLYEIITTEAHVWLVLEYCREDELYNYLLKKGRLDVTQASKVFSQLVGAVAYVHQNHCAHRDLKLENILLDKRLNVKLTDFGFTREYEPRSLLETICGTTCYMAPELLLHKKYNGEAIDVWSLGIILYTLLEGEMPFEEENDADTKTKIIEEEPRFPQNDIDEDALELINKMLSKDPKKRPSVMEILNDPFLAEHCQVQLDILQTAPPKPFTTKSEKRLLRKLKSSHFDIDTLTKSVVNRKCDTLAGIWELTLEREIKAEANRPHRASINLSKYSLTKTIAAGYDATRSRSSSKGPSSRPGSRAVSVDSTNSPRSPRSPLARLSGNMRPSFENQTRDSRRSTSVSSVRRREFSTTSLTSPASGPITESGEEENKHLTSSLHVASPLSQSSPAAVTEAPDNYIDISVQEPKKYIPASNQPEHTYGGAVTEDVISTKSGNVPSTGSARGSLSKTASRRSSLFTASTKESSSTLKKLMIKLNPLRRKTSKTYENSLRSNNTERTESGTAPTTVSLPHSHHSATLYPDNTGNESNTPNRTASPSNVPGINVEKDTADSDTLSVSKSQRTNSLDASKISQLSVGSRPRPISQISQLSSLSQASQYSTNSQISSLASQASGSLKQRKHSASSATAKKSRPFYDRRSTSSSFSSLVSNQKKHHSKTSSTSSASLNNSPIRQSNPDFSNSRYDNSIISFESTSSAGASIGKLASKSSRSSATTMGRGRFNESAVFAGRSSTPLSKTRRKSAFAEAFSSLNPHRKSRTVAPLSLASRTSVIVENDEILEEAQENSRGETSERSLDIAQEKPQYDLNERDEHDEQAEERGRRM